MSAFVDLDWRRIDACAIVTFGGLATIEDRRHPACGEWLRRENYDISTFDCRDGLDVAIPALGQMLGWEQQFGYALGSESRNLNALRDGFNFDIPEGGGKVFEILGVDRAWQEDPNWLCGLLEIVQEHSRRQLAVGRRFFGLLVVPAESPLIDIVFREVRVPGPFSHPCRELHEFIR